jgi:hypothetical protein
MIFRSLKKPNMMGLKPCYCKGIIMIVLGLLLLLENLQIITIGILPYWPAMFIILGVCWMLPCCMCKNDDKYNFAGIF